MEAPRDCVVRYQIGPGRVLLVSYDRHGVDYEKLETNPAEATQVEEDRMLEKVRARDEYNDHRRHRILRIVPLS